MKSHVYLLGMFLLFAFMMISFERGAAKKENPTYISFEGRKDGFENSQNFSSSSVSESIRDEDVLEQSREKERVILELFNGLRKTDVGCSKAVEEQCR